MSLSTKFVKSIIASYIETAYLDDDETITFETAERDVMSFLYKVKSANIDITEFAGEYIGHDFWLTRQGHGAGFWYRPQYYGDDAAAETFDTAETLSDIARSFGAYYQ